MEKDWLMAVGKLTYGIYVLTSAHDTEINGMIASWVSQVSYDPPLVMAAVHTNRYTHRLIEKSGCFALHVLAQNQQEFLARFKGPDSAEKFSGLQWEKGHGGCPILKDCVAYLACEVKERYAPGNHTLYVGEIINAKVLTENPTLSTLDYDGFYTGKT